MTATASTADLAADLIAHLRAAYAPDVEPDVDVPETTERFVVDDDAKACWVLRKIAELRAEVDRVDAVAAEETARIAAWRDGLTAKARRSVAYFEAVLQPYTASRTDAKVRTVHLVAGDLCARKSQSSLVVTDAEALLTWLREHDRQEFLKVEPRVGDLKAALARDAAKEIQTVLPWGPGAGEPIPGIVVEAGDDVYSAKPAPLPTVD